MLVLNILLEIKLLRFYKHTQSKLLKLKIVWLFNYKNVAFIVFLNFVKV